MLALEVSLDSCLLGDVWSDEVSLWFMNLKSLLLVVFSTRFRYHAPL